MILEKAGQPLTEHSMRFYAVNGTTVRYKYHPPPSERETSSKTDAMSSLPLPIELQKVVGIKQTGVCVG